MVDFSFYLSDTDESAVDDLISQAQDLCVLDQVSTFKCSGFTDSLLPTELESRFCKLKSFPESSAFRLPLLTIGSAQCNSVEAAKSKYRVQKSASFFFQRRRSVSNVPYQTRRNEDIALASGWASYQTTRANTYVRCCPGWTNDKHA
ncbi:hypothetical protein EV2_028849 [Malus domestica]